MEKFRLLGIFGKEHFLTTTIKHIKGKGTDLHFLSESSLAMLCKNTIAFNWANTSSLCLCRPLVPDWSRLCVQTSALFILLSIHCIWIDLKHETSILQLLSSTAN